MQAPSGSIDAAVGMVHRMGPPIMHYMFWMI